MLGQTCGIVEDTMKVKEFEGEKIVIDSAPIDLEKTSATLGDVMHEPEQFPGLISSVISKFEYLMLFILCRLSNSELSSTRSS